MQLCFILPIDLLFFYVYYLIAETPQSFGALIADRGWSCRGEGVVLTSSDPTSPLPRPRRSPNSTPSPPYTYFSRVCSESRLCSSAYMSDDVARLSADNLTDVMAFCISADAYTRRSSVKSRCMIPIYDLMSRLLRKTYNCFLQVPSKHFLS